mgnify:CR=1 FL=1
MEFDEKLKMESHKILSTFFDKWLEGEQAKCDKIKDEISELEEQRDNRILELARDDYPDKEINSIRELDKLLLLDSELGIREARARQKYSYYKSVSALNEEIDAKRNELDPIKCDVTNAIKFDNGVEFLSKVAEIEQLEGEIEQLEGELSNLQKRLESAKKQANSQKNGYIKNKNSYDKLMKEFEEYNKEVA